MNPLDQLHAIIAGWTNHGYPQVGSIVLRMCDDASGRLEMYPYPHSEPQVIGQFSNIEELEALLERETQGEEIEPR